MLAFGLSVQYDTETYKPALVRATDVFGNGNGDLDQFSVIRCWPPVNGAYRSTAASPGHHASRFNIGRAPAAPLL